MSTITKVKRQQSMPVVQNAKPVNKNSGKPMRRFNSTNSIEELVKCEICLSKLEKPKMLHCQHTFCYKCLEPIWQRNNQNGELHLDCPVCQKRTNILNLNQLVTNIYVNNLLELIQEEGISKTCPQSTLITTKPAMKVCLKCKKEQPIDQVTQCHHCQMYFCTAFQCHEKHTHDLIMHAETLKEQLTKSKLRLDYELDQYKSHCENVVAKIENVIDEKVKELRDLGIALPLDIERNLQEATNSTATILNEMHPLLAVNFAASADKVNQFIDFEQKVNSLNERLEKVTFSYKLFDEESLQLVTDGMRSAPSCYDEVDSKSQDYTGKKFYPKMVCKELRKPTGLCASPWKSNEVYVCNMNHIYTLDIVTNKITNRLEHEEMQYAQSIVCDYSTRRIFVCDNWKKCIHIFNADGGYVGKITPARLSSPNGIALDNEGNLVICDTGNNRVVVVSVRNGEILNTIGMIDNRTEFLRPSDVSIAGKYIVIADAGNTRIKVFDANTHQRLHVFGSSGAMHGEINNANVVHLDRNGHILVGDVGNKRIQVFDIDGKFLNSSDLDWENLVVSGLCTTGSNDIVVADAKSMAIYVF